MERSEGLEHLISQDGTAKQPLTPLNQGELLFRWYDGTVYSQYSKMRILEL